MKTLLSTILHNWIHRFFSFHSWFQSSVTLLFVPRATVLQSKETIFSIHSMTKEVLFSLVYKLHLWKKFREKEKRGRKKVEEERRTSGSVLELLVKPVLCFQWIKSWKEVKLPFKLMSLFFTLSLILKLKLNLIQFSTFLLTTFSWLFFKHSLSTLFPFSSLQNLIFKPSPLLFFSLSSLRVSFSDSRFSSPHFQDKMITLQSLNVFPLLFLTFILSFLLINSFSLLFQNFSPDLTRSFSWLKSHYLCRHSRKEDFEVSRKGMDKGVRKRVNETSRKLFCPGKK